ncbi:hypothetical protein AB1Y20_009358 [Prymnesium parvum]|uniref:Uncharacterized protein n=1 Tax=Prymnesium parvum TaxID=97485 RepID=A0AB34K4B4_PRYPA
MLWLLAASLTNCEPWCRSPCRELNGNVVYECGGCISEACRPGAPGYPTLESARSPTAARPRCGRLIPSQVSDMAPLCVHLDVAASSLGELTLRNSSATNTRATRLPEKVTAASAAWWAVRDGVLWASVPSGFKDGGAIKPFSFAAVYRAPCVGAACPPASFYDVAVTISLRQVENEAPLLGEHALSVRVTPSTAGLPAVHGVVEWAPCLLECKATLVQGDGRAGGEATRLVHPNAKQPPEWCFGSQAQKVLDGEHEIGGTRSIDLSKTPSACEQYAETNATNAVHIQYFLEQQRAETAMMDSIESAGGLCARGGDDEATFQARLEKLLQPVRMAVRLHVHMAFIAKGVCSRNTAIDRQRAMEQKQLLQLPSYADGYFYLIHPPGERLMAHQEWTASAVQSLGWGDDEKKLVSEGRDTWLHLLSPYTHAQNRSIEGHALWTLPSDRKVMSVDPEFLPDQPDPDTDWCPLPILHHEQYNTWESWFVWNLTSYLLQAGASFCRMPLPSRAPLVASWREQLEAVQHRHRHNNAFLVYSTAYEAPCKRLQLLADVRSDVRPQKSDEWRERTRAKQRDFERYLVQQMEAVRRAGPCDLANVTAADLVDAFGNDTYLALAMGKALLTRGTILVLDGRSPCEALPRPRVEELSRVIGEIPGEARLRRLPAMTKWGAWMLTLSTAYHKLVPICQPADPLYARFEPDNWACETQPLPAEPDGKLVYDLVPMDSSRGFCYGEKCGRAARAIDKYRAFLHRFSRFRMTLVHSMIAFLCPFATEENEFLTLLLHLQKQLPELLAELRRALDGLVAACVAPSRSNERQASSNWQQAVQLRQEAQARA